MPFSKDPFSIVGSSGGGAPEPIYEYDFSTTPTTALLISNIFESGKDYKIVVKGAKRDSATGTFNFPSFDLEEPGGSFGSYIIYREYNNVGNTTKTSFAGASRATVDAGFGLQTTNLTDVEIKIYQPRTSTLQTRGRLDVFGWDGSGEAQQGWAISSNNTKAADEYSGIKVFAVGNSPVNAGILEVYEL